MATKHDIKLRIRAVQTTKKTTKAMKLVAASKLNQVRNALDAATPYANYMNNIASQSILKAASENISSPLLIKNDDINIHLIVCIFSERGLCGAFNSNLARAIKRDVQEMRNEGKQIKFICIGKKAYDFLKSNFSEQIIEHIVFSNKKGASYKDAIDIASKIIGLFTDRQFSSASLVYNQFINVISQVSVNEQLLPMQPAHDFEPIDTLFEFEPKLEDLLYQLLPEALAVQIYYALLHSATSEQASRMVAMDNASKNADSIIQKLTLIYNRTRQASITKELIEIIAGAGAV
jgi:F-type H+-transporting ATPase subunit gamma